ncbi:MAG: CBS domain-containing protein [Phycisphaerales bacterium]
MGTQEVQQVTGEQRRVFMQRLLADVKALERMIAEGLFETDVRRVGAEQELVLVDDHWQPAPVAVDVLARISDKRVTHELGTFNVEFNCDPIVFKGDCLSKMRAQIGELLGIVGIAASASGAHPLLIGILPTLQLSDLCRENIVPKPRYYALDEMIRELRGGHYELRIKGIDELTIQHDSVMLEALNTSFQLHYQVTPKEFPLAFNTAQALAGPVLAACVNSPVLFGKRLWRETRIAIFQQAVDTRPESSPHERDLLARVRFGERWCKDSVLELFKDDVARFRVMFGAETDEAPLDALDQGRIPKLTALCTHNSTVYRWNRPCYGITDGKPHLRIENRYLASGPSVIDEMANAALWFGLMTALPAAFPDLTERLAFEDAANNFVIAARSGLESQLTWLDERTMPAPDLVRSVLLPLAREGLASAGIDEKDSDELLEIIDRRVETNRTGARWMLASVAKMQGQGTRAERLGALTAATAARQASGEPVHTWDPATLEEAGAWERNYQRVGQYMVTDVLTVQDDELIDLAASIMDWERVRHVPVEDAEHNLVGMLSYRELLRQLVDPKRKEGEHTVSVGDVMRRDPVCVTPETSTLDAIELMREHGVSCLPVVANATRKLVGIVTEHDYMRIAGKLLERELRAQQGADAEGGASV